VASFTVTGKITSILCLKTNLAVAAEARSLAQIEGLEEDFKMEYLFTASLWIGYCALHSYLISLGFTNLIIRLLRNYYAFYRLFYILISLVLLIPLIKYTGQADTRIIITYEYPLSIVRYALIAGSLTMFCYAFFFNYDSLSFFGIRQILNFKKAKDIDSSTDIRKNGLLGIIRHPMYLALIIYLWCQTFRIMDIVINAVLTIYIVIGTKLEEKKLVLEYGDTYIKYQQEVPMLIPFTKARSN
jgi:methanethiol S-methyltransferase